MRIGKLELNMPFLMAPLAGITDAPTRRIYLEYGASLAYTEMISAKGLVYGDGNTIALLSRLCKGFRRYRECGIRKFDCEPVAAFDTKNGPCAVQIFGHEPEVIEEAAYMLAPLPNAVLDINMGCPVPKIVKNGEGSALLKDLPLLEAVCEAAVKGTRRGLSDRGMDPESKAVTAKLRIGFAEADLTHLPALHAQDLKALPRPHPCGEAGYQSERTKEAQLTSLPEGAKRPRELYPAQNERSYHLICEAAKRLENAGAGAVTIHGRTREQFYSGKADWKAIAAVKKAVKIPVIGNGDLFSGADALRMMKETGCDGVMFARGALGNPWIFREASALWNQRGKEAHPADGAICESGPDDSKRISNGISAQESDRVLIHEENADTDYYPPTTNEKVEMAVRHLNDLCEEKGERIAVREMRKFVGWYLKGERGSAAVRRAANSAQTAEEMRALFNSIPDIDAAN